MVSAKAGCVFMGFILYISGVQGPAIRICALKGSSVDLTCSAQHPTSSMKWYTVHRDDYMQVLNESAKRDGVSYVSENSDFNLKIKDVTEKKNADKPNPCWRNRIQLHIEGLDDQNCWSMNNVSRRICALEGSTVNISSEYLHPDNQSSNNKVWYKIKSRGPKDAEELTEATGHVELYDVSGKQDDTERKHKVLVMFTGLKVECSPSAVVTEGQRVTLTCSTSCPLTDNTNYLWFLNSRLLTQTENQNKQLVLDPVSSQHAGNYYCAVKTQNNLSSQEKTLTVHTITRKWIPAAAAGVCAALMVIIPLVVFLLIRRRRTSRQSPETEAAENIEQPNADPVYENIWAQPAEQEELNYSTVFFSKTQAAPLHSTIQPHEPKEQEPAVYAVVNFRSSSS